MPERKIGEEKSKIGSSLFTSMINREFTKVPYSYIIIINNNSNLTVYKKVTQYTVSGSKIRCTCIASTIMVHWHPVPVANQLITLIT